MILLHPEDFIQADRVLLAGRRALHVREIHRAVAGESLRVGVLNSRTGTGIIRESAPDRITMDVTLDSDPPAPLPVTLLLAMPRPKGFRRIMQGVASLGVKRIALFGAFRVEKSYWKSPWLVPEALREQLVLGLEQARDTILPEVTIHPLFKPFVEDVVPALSAGSRKLVAHPGNGMACPASVPDPVTLAIGPEGGFTDFEVGLLAGQGFQSVTLGPRILRTEQAVPAFLGRLMAG